MNNTYKYNHHSVRHHRAFWVVLGITIFVLAPVAFFIYKDISNNGSVSVEGEGRIVGQVVGDNSDGFAVNEELFSLSLPEDWKELERADTAVERSITWVATKENQDARWLTLYIDKIPPEIAVNRLLPVTIRGTGLVLGDVSDNCATFTEGGSLNVNEAAKLRPTVAQWQEVKFICNLPAVIDNEVGVSTSQGINTITMSGAKGGEHTYFFLFTDHTIQPNYTILKNAIESFRVK